MSEYWKSTPKYWCKHCGLYVKDTKLERANHESTAKHQGSLKRFLRDIHRDHEREERDKERARREVERLNGVVSGSSTAPTFGGQDATSSKSSGGLAAERQRQMEQLASLGVSLPTEVRSEMALPGEWTVTSTRIIKDKANEDKKEVPVEARATGVRKREQPEEEAEEEAAVRGLLKRPRKWGKDSKTLPEEEDAELDALLSESIMPAKKEEPDAKVKEERLEDNIMRKDDAEEAAAAEHGNEAVVKREPGVDGDALREEPSLAPDDHSKPEEPGADPSPILFKKRKPKTIRQK